MTSEECIMDIERSPSWASEYTVSCRTHGVIQRDVVNVSVDAVVAAHVMEIKRGKLTTIELTDRQIMVLGALAYDEWSNAHGVLRDTKAEDADGTVEWLAFHKERLRRAQERVDAAADALEAIKPVYFRVLTGPRK